MSPNVSDPEPGDGLKTNGAGILSVEVPIFNRHVVVVYGCDHEEAEDICYRHGGRNSRVSFGADAIGGVRLYRGDVWMWVKDPVNNASTVFHELVHVAYAILEAVGATFDEETIAYLVGWLKIEVADPIFYANDKFDVPKESKDNGKDEEHY